MKHEFDKVYKGCRHCWFMNMKNTSRVEPRNYMATCQKLNKCKEKKCKTCPYYSEIGTWAGIFFDKYQRHLFGDNRYKKSGYAK